MRADAVVVALAPLAIHTKNLEAFRETVPLQPAVKLLACSEVASPLVLGPIVVDVVNAQERALSLPTACATVSTVGHIDIVANGLSTRGVALVDSLPVRLLFFPRHGGKAFSALPILSRVDLVL